MLAFAHPQQVKGGRKNDQRKWTILMLIRSYPDCGPRELRYTSHQKVCPLITDAGYVVNRSNCRVSRSSICEANKSLILEPRHFA